MKLVERKKKVSELTLGQKGTDIGLDSAKVFLGFMGDRYSANIKFDGAGYQVIQLRDVRFMATRETIKVPGKGYTVADFDIEGPEWKSYFSVRGYTVVVDLYNQARSWNLEIELHTHPAAIMSDIGFRLPSDVQDFIKNQL